MAKDQFQIPNSLFEHDGRAQLDAVHYSPEKQPGPYHYIKEIENKIYSYRDTALATDMPRKGWLTGLAYAPQRKTIHDLIEKESKKGGEVFGRGHRFWLDTKPGATFQTDVADWYHTQPNPADPKHPIVLRFQTTATQVHKLFDGREYQPTIEDLERFVAAVIAYSHKVRSLYPIDDTLATLEAELEAEAQLAAALPKTASATEASPGVPTPEVSMAADDFLLALGDKIPDTAEELVGSEEYRHILRDVYATYTAQHSETRHSESGDQ